MNLLFFLCIKIRPLWHWPQTMPTPKEPWSWAHLWNSTGPPGGWLCSLPPRSQTPWGEDLTAHLWWYSDTLLPFLASVDIEAIPFSGERWELLSEGFLGLKPLPSFWKIFQPSSLLWRGVLSHTLTNPNKEQNSPLSKSSQDDLSKGFCHGIPFM